MKPEATRARPARITGAGHLFAALTYSLGGVRRLWQETALRHEVLAFVLALGWSAFIGATLIEFAVLCAVFLMLVAVEAINTAVECIVDHVSPEWAVFARDAKDLGSLAVMCMLLIAAIVLGIVTARHVLMA
ncbi:MAG: diacylglycerol kinase [Rhodobacteraceae bacterium]|nr:diacylglycerol kinase [Paracoccaceae bacterium]